MQCLDAVTSSFDLRFNQSSQNFPSKKEKEKKRKKEEDPVEIADENACIIVLTVNPLSTQLDS